MSVAPIRDELPAGETRAEAAPAARGGPWRETVLTGWGRTSRATSLAARPERQSALRSALQQAEGSTVLAYGAGRSYGDAALNDGGHALLTERLDRLVSFDSETGELVAEPGVTFKTVMEVLLPRGWMVPVTPGTAFATLGGAVANDVHGKNQESAGNFGDHLNWIELLTADGSIVRASPAENAELFRATVGGIGLTGVVTSLSLNLARVPGNAAAVTLKRLPDLDSVIEGLTTPHPGTPYSVAWIDALSGGRNLGRGILELAAPSDTPLPEKAARAKALPLDLPGFVLSGPTVRAFNELYWRRIPAGGAQRTVPWRDFLYPLDAIHQWNRMYGKAGFHQFQCVVPMPGAPAAIRMLLEALGRAGRASFLAVLKAMGRPGLGHLSFAQPGLTLAVDIPNRPGVEALLAELERLTLDAGGRVYLAKDSALSPQGFRAMYPRLPEFREALATWDPQGRFDSDMARRLRIREDLGREEQL
ncbi:MAG TPA: FAD-binding oxidoreductase [Azospirillaceae bacterium]|nr:FAD-binding oxidoreductase [Azospirillaceae bacterium]